MGKRGKSSERTASNRAKRLKVQATVEANAPIVTWSDLHYDIIRDIFRHLPTTEEARCCRVSAGWNTVLVEQLSRSSVISLQYHDLQKWETIFDPAARETRGATKVQKVKLVSEHARMLIMDFGNIVMQPRYNLHRVVFGLRYGNRGPAPVVMENHPQINRIVVYRARLDTSCVGHAWMRYTAESLAHMQRSLAIEECEVIKTWCLPWPNMNLTRDCQPVWETKFPFHKTVSKLYSTNWDYPPEQLEWLEVCLGMLPTKDRLHAYLDYNSPFEHLDERFCVTLLGRTHQKGTAAFCARYLTTFRKELDLPSPSHPLIWKD